MLIAMACSGTKRPDAGELPAIDRYDGPMWRTLRAALAELPESARPEVWFLSARYGFHPATLPIVNYDGVLSEARARDLLRMPSSNFNTFAMAVAQHPQALFAGGLLYRDTMRRAAGPTPAAITETDSSEGIGAHRAQLRAWIARTCA